MHATTYTTWHVVNIYHWVYYFIDQVCGVKFVTYGDFRRKISRKVPTVIISNHGSLFDLHCLIRGLRGLFGNMTLSQAFPVTTERFRRSHIYLGWLKQMHHFIFVKRDWARDCIHMKKLIHYLLEICSTIQVVLYPEGMVRTDASMKEDKVYAESKGFATFKHLLHLKVKGFVAIVQACRSGGNGEVEICEVTVAYKGKSGQCSYAGPIGGVQLPTGELPHEVHFHFKYHPSSSLPSSDEELREWLYKRWCEKDELLTQFHETNSFPGPVLQESWRSKLEMRLAMGAWALLVAAIIYFWIQMPLLMGVIMGTSALIHYIIDKWCDGWERLALKRWENSKN